MERTISVSLASYLCCCCASPESSDCSRRVEDDLRPVHAEQEPVEGMMSAVADVDSDPPKLSLEHCVACVAFHVVGGLMGRQLAASRDTHRHTRTRTHTHLVEVSDAGDVVFAALSQHRPRVGDDHGGVPQGSVPIVTLQDW